MTTLSNDAPDLMKTATRFDSLQDLTVTYDRFHSSLQPYAPFQFLNGALKRFEEISKEYLRDRTPPEASERTEESTASYASPSQKPSVADTVRMILADVEATAREFFQVSSAIQQNPSSIITYRSMQDRLQKATTTLCAIQDLFSEILSECGEPIANLSDRMVFRSFSTDEGAQSTIIFDFTNRCVWHSNEIFVGKEQAQILPDGHWTLFTQNQKITGYFEPRKEPNQLGSGSDEAPSSRTLTTSDFVPIGKMRVTLVSRPDGELNEGEPLVTSSLGLEASLVRNPTFDAYFSPEKPPGTGVAHGVFRGRGAYTQSDAEGIYCHSNVKLTVSGASVQFDPRQGISFPEAIDVQVQLQPVESGQGMSSDGDLEINDDSKLPITTLLGKATKDPNSPAGFSMQNIQRNLGSNT